MAALFHFYLTTMTTSTAMIHSNGFQFRSVHKPLRFIIQKNYPRVVRPILSINIPRSLSSIAVPKISNDPIFDLDRDYLSCSMPNTNRPLKVVVLFSGGVDGIVSLRFLPQPNTPALLSTLKYGSKYLTLFMSISVAILLTLMFFAVRESSLVCSFGNLAT
ncbi:hypothetical protein Ccrd_001087 [Cynara cardunculus var. scolymus]|uniref:Uncharacterized protein n=1 Tax=Cynara cardunculus var. scolymus TaxID=59895 RepID=A0A124SDF9_CYNCS|nr:hypothetical protein Ccrd_001087 [Cynara cardunculus var. scolymus]